MQRRVALVVPGVDVDVQLLDEVFRRRQHAAGREAVVVRRKAFAVALARRGEQRRHSRTAKRDRRQPGNILHRTFTGIAGPRTAGPLARRQVRIGAARDEELHRIDVGGIGRAPERRRPDLVNA